METSGPWNAKKELIRLNDKLDRLNEKVDHLSKAHAKDGRFVRETLKLVFDAVHRGTAPAAATPGQDTANEDLYKTISLQRKLLIFAVLVWLLSGFLYFL